MRRHTGTADIQRGNTRKQLIPHLSRVFTRCNRKFGRPHPMHSVSGDCNSPQTPFPRTNKPRFAVNFTFQRSDCYHEHHQHMSGIPTGRPKRMSSVCRPGASDLKHPHRGMARRRLLERGSALYSWSESQQTAVHYSACQTFGAAGWGKRRGAVSGARLTSSWDATCAHQTVFSAR